MDNTYARDILDRLPPLPLTEYNSVRVECGHNWVELEIRDGKPTLRGSRGFLIRLMVANQIAIEFDE